jgi:hypothetical protein
MEKRNGRWVIAVNRFMPSIAHKFSRKRAVIILRGELAKLRGSLIAISSVQVWDYFLKSGFVGSEGGPYPLVARDRESRELWKGKEPSPLRISQRESAKVRHSNSQYRELREALVLKQ